MGYTDTISSKFADHADPKNAVKMSSYMKDRFPFFGIKTPLRRTIGKELIDRHGLPEIADLERTVFDLFSKDERELHHFGIELCAEYKKKWTRETIHLFEKMAQTKSWWDTVDSINIFCIKPFFAIFPNERAKCTQSWIDSGNIWLQRLSIICQLRLKEDTDTELLSRNILQLNQSDEFFIQKAIGWALRDFGHSNPEWVREFVRKTELKPLSKREALKHL